MFPVDSATFGCSKELLKALSSSSVLQERPRTSRCPGKTTLQSTANSTHKAIVKQKLPPRVFEFSTLPKQDKDRQSIV